MKESHKEYLYTSLNAGREELAKRSCIKHGTSKDKKSAQLTSKQKRVQANKIKNLRILGFAPFSPKHLEFSYS